MRSRIWLSLSILLALLVLVIAPTLIFYIVAGIRGALYTLIALAFPLLFLPALIKILPTPSQARGNSFISKFLSSYLSLELSFLLFRVTAFCVAILMVIALGYIDEHYIPDKYSHVKESSIPPFNQ